MESFRVFLEQQEFVDYIIESFDKPTQSWSAKKDQIIQTWKQIQVDTPIYITPITPETGKSLDRSSYGEDGIRLTGSWSFIASIMGRLKDLLQFENPKTKLRLAFKGVEGKNNKQAFAFYINLETRKPKKIKFEKPEIPGL